MAQKKSKQAPQRTRNFATEVYPESCLDNWVDLLRDLKIQCFVSPLHDKDKKEDGTPKKPHWHVQLIYDSVKTVDQVKEDCSKFGGVGVEVIRSKVVYARYLCHLDNPEKAQYLISEVMQFNGADYLATIRLCVDKNKCIYEMMDWVNKEDIDYFSDLMDYAAAEQPEWFDCLNNSGAYSIKEYIKSRTYKKHKMLEK